ncbi:hypothetical protein BDN72DRAFT_886268 [Pluteus cervinus]|uniref:Uncharacterized protein n=1 Tax=Pluteus cervinus TaxID=181527 RepID=A0ACD3BA84_9AGAR|nr:hypothetical protein BDN72DRAFT_886268 [Pluteus cervinus]
MAPAQDVLSHFSALDELTQVIYQSIYRFVVLSNVSQMEGTWTVHVALVGKEGRWWRGIWGTDDILGIVGSKSSDKILEAFASNLAEAFIKGELHIGDWSTEAGAKINLVLGPGSKRPLSVPLTEISAAEAAVYATNVFFEIALQAQSRRGQLHSTSTSLPSLPLTDYRPITSTLNDGGPAMAGGSKPTTSNPGPSTSSTTVVRPEPIKVPETPAAAVAEKKAQAEIKALKAQLEAQKRRQPSTPTPPPKAAPPRPLKGASLANPHKKARKYQALEFESDGE